MASPRGSKTRIHMKHILVVFTGIFTTLLFIGSIVMIAIGYMNPFGGIGLGILGGGCVVFFSAVLFLCASSIWIKNKYYPDEMDCGKKLVGSSSEDLKLLNTAPLLFSSEHTEGEWIKGKELRADNRNSVPLYSVSTVYSSVSSLEMVVPEYWQKEDIPGAMDSDVFSSSAFQHSDIKAQQQLELDAYTSELAVSDSTGHTVQKVKDRGEKQHAYIVVKDNRNYGTELPQQQKPEDVDKMEGLPSSHYYVPHKIHDKQMEKQLTDSHIVITEDTYSTTIRDLCGRNAQFSPMENLQTKSTFSPKGCKGELLNDKGGVVKCFQDSKQYKGLTQQNTQTDRHESFIPDSTMQNTRKPNKEDIILDKALYNVPTGDLDTKHRTRQNINKLSEEKSEIPLQFLLPKSQQDLSSSKTTEEDAKK